MSLLFRCHHEGEHHEVCQEGMNHVMWRCWIWQVFVGVLLGMPTTQERGPEWHEWQCQFCCKVIKCILRLNFHCVTGCPVVGILKMYPVVHKTNEMQWNMLSIRRVSWTLNRNLNLKFQSIKNDTNKCLRRPPKQTFYSTMSFNTRSCRNQLHLVQDPQRVGCSK
jgi:hypothetical protein